MTYTLGQSIALPADLTSLVDNPCGLYRDQVEELMAAPTHEWQAWRCWQYDAYGRQVHRNTVLLVFDATAGVGGVCEGGPTDWLDGQSAEGVLQSYDLMQQNAEQS